ASGKVRPDARGSSIGSPPAMPAAYHPSRVGYTAARSRAIHRAPGQWLAAVVLPAPLGPMKRHARPSISTPAACNTRPPSRLTTAPVSAVTSAEHPESLGTTSAL